MGSIVTIGNNKTLFPLHWIWQEDDFGWVIPLEVEIWFNFSFNCFQIASLLHQSEYCCHTKISKQCCKNEIISKLLFCPRTLFYLWPLNIRFLATRPPAKHGLMNVYGFTLLPRPTRKLEKSQKKLLIHFFVDITHIPFLLSPPRILEGLKSEIHRLPRFTLFRRFLRHIHQTYV